MVVSKALRMLSYRLPAWFGSKSISGFWGMSSSSSRRGAVMGVHPSVSATARVIADEQADIAELAESLGVGTVSGFGQSVTESTGYGVDDFDAAFTARKEG